MNKRKRKKLKKQYYSGLLFGTLYPKKKWFNTRIPLHSKFIRKPLKASKKQQEIQQHLRPFIFNNAQASQTEKEK